MILELYKESKYLSEVLLRPITIESNINPSRKYKYGYTAVVITGTDHRYVLVILTFFE